MRLPCGGWSWVGDWINDHHTPGGADNDNWEESLDKQLSDKGVEINGYMETHNIQLKDQQGGGKKEDKSGGTRTPLSPGFAT